MFKNTVLNYSAQNVKSVYSVYGSGNTFTADVETVDANFASSTAITEFSFSGTKGYKYLECTGFGASAGRYLVQGDAIQFSDDAGTIHKFIVDYATDAQGTTKSRIYFNGALPAVSYTHLTLPTILRV